MGNISLETVVQELRNIFNAVKTNSISTQVVETTTTGSISGKFSKASFYVSGASDGSLTVNGTTITAYSGATYNFGGELNQLCVDTISYDATGTTFQIFVSRQ
jgi:hypothetical protein